MSNILLLIILIIPIISVCLNLHFSKIKYIIISSKLILLNAILSIILFFNYNFDLYFINFFDKETILISKITQLSHFDIILYEWGFNQEFNNWFLLTNLSNVQVIGQWIFSHLLTIDWAFSLNSLNTIMLIVVNLISGLVHIYSLDYMVNDNKIYKFFSYLSLFTFFMILLITGDNFIILFLGWEGVGLCSYLLISFWNTRLQANKSAIKALVVNRIADWALTLGILLIFFVFNTLTFDNVFSLIRENTIYFSEQTNNLNENSIWSIFFYNQNIISLITALLFIGAMGKSAQIGLHTWLPDAMEGPTPVSALIHAATMVTAGVFLIIKCSPLFESVPFILTHIVFIGALTSFMAATIGLIQNDIKKVVAYSTCSQLGYMIFACGLSNYHVAFFHLVNHAFFKALLFLSAGAIIHSLSDEQDMRRYGSLFNLIPFTALMLFLGSITLMGFPFLTGYYSKDLILEISFSKYTLTGLLAYIFGLMSAFCTSFYSYRVFYLTFLQPNVSNHTIIQKTHELPKRMAYVLILLGLGSIFFGYFTKDLFIGLGSDFFLDSIYISINHNNQVQAEFLPQIIKLLPFWVSLFAVLLVNILFYKSKTIFFLGQTIFYEIYKFLVFKWYFDWFYNKFINKNLLQLSLNLFKNIDKQILEWIGPFGLQYIFYNISNNLKKMQTGSVQHYIYLLIISLFFILFEFNKLSIYV